jgi:hypothetical protein
MGFAIPFVFDGDSDSEGRLIVDVHHMRGQIVI